MRALLLMLLISFVTSAFADQLIIEPDMGRQPIVDAINQAKQSIHLVMYGFTDEALLSAILKQKSHGKTIKIILEDQPYKVETENEKIIRQFEQNQISWQ